MLPGDGIGEAQKIEHRAFDPRPRERAERDAERGVEALRRFDQAEGAGGLELLNVEAPRRARAHQIRDRLHQPEICLCQRLAIGDQLALGPRRHHVQGARPGERVVRRFPRNPCSRRLRLQHGPLRGGELRCCSVVSTRPPTTPGTELPEKQNARRRASMWTEGEAGRSVYW